MSLDKYDALRIEKQLCFPLYACSKEVVRRYRPFLDPLDLTYTQYIAMMVLWEQRSVTVKELGERLYLDSGTLTPLLKKLEAKGFITRKRSSEDERSLIVTVTDAGDDLREKAKDIPAQMTKANLNLEVDEIRELYRMLYKLLSQVNQ